MAKFILLLGFVSATAAGANPFHPPVAFISVPASNKHEGSITQKNCIEHDASNNEAASTNKRNTEQKRQEILSAKEQYDKSVTEYNRLERLINQSAAADKADGHTLEKVFSDDDVAEIAELMLEKATAAASAKALYEEEQAHMSAVAAEQSAEEAIMFEGMAMNAERELHAMEKQVDEIEGFDDEADSLERKRDLSAVHAVKHTLYDAEQHAKESKLAKDQARLNEAHARKEYMQMKLNKAELREDAKELHSVIVEKSNEDFKKHKKP